MVVSFTLHHVALTDSDLRDIYELRRAVNMLAVMRPRRGVHLASYVTMKARAFVDARSDINVETACNALASIILDAGMLDAWVEMARYGCATVCLLV